MNVHECLFLIYLRTEIPRPTGDDIVGMTERYQRWMRFEELRDRLLELYDGSQQLRLEHLALVRTFVQEHMPATAADDTTLSEQANYLAVLRWIEERELDSAGRTDR